MLNKEEGIRSLSINGIGGMSFAHYIRSAYGIALYLHPIPMGFGQDEVMGESTNRFDQGFVPDSYPITTKHK